VLKKIEQGRRATENMQKTVDRLRPQIEAYENFCAEIGENPADVGLAWLLSNPVVTAPIIGPSSIDQFKGSLRALEIKLGAEQLQKLDSIWPGPGGTAPEAYAW
jgi:aryl-alcohol dehydrogenase-like predicted oxidoreductase